MRVGTGNELSGKHEALLGEIEVKDAVTWCGVIRRLQFLLARERAPDACLLVVVLTSGEHEVIVRDRRLPRVNRAAASDLVEGVDRKRRGAIRRWKQISVDTQRVAGLELPLLLVHPMRPDDLLCRRHRTRTRRIGKLDDRRSFDRAAQLSPSNGNNAAALSKLVFLGSERHRVVGSILRDVGELSRFRIEREFIAVACVFDRLRALHDVKTEVEGIAAEDVAHIASAHDHHLETGLVSDALEPGRAHLTRRSDRKSIARNDKRLAAMNTGAKVGHEIPEGARLPSFVQCLEALGNAVGRRRDLIGIDGVEFAAISGAGELRIPEDQRTSPNRPHLGTAGGHNRREIRQSNARPQLHATDYLHL